MARALCSSMQLLSVIMSVGVNAAWTERSVPLCKFRGSEWGLLELGGIWTYLRKKLFSRQHTPSLSQAGHLLYISSAQKKQFLHVPHCYFVKRF